jgi:hypothetical protein
MPRPIERFTVALTPPTPERPRAPLGEVLAPGLRLLALVLCGYLAGLLCAAWLGS